MSSDGPTPLYTGNVGGRDSVISHSAPSASGFQPSKLHRFARWLVIFLILCSWAASSIAVSSMEWVSYIVIAYDINGNWDPSITPIKKIFSLWNELANGRLKTAQAFAIITSITLLFLIICLIIEQTMGNKRKYWLSVLNNFIMGLAVLFSMIPCIVFLFFPYYQLLIGFICELSTLSTLGFTLLIYTFLNLQSNWNSKFILSPHPFYSELSLKIRICRIFSTFLITSSLILCIIAVLSPAWAFSDPTYCPPTTGCGRHILFFLFPDISTDSNPRLIAAQAFILLTILFSFLATISSFADMRLNRSSTALFTTTTVILGFMCSIVGMGTVFNPLIRELYYGLQYYIAATSALGFGCIISTIGYFMSGWKGIKANSSIVNNDDPYANSRLLRSQSEADMESESIGESIQFDSNNTDLNPFSSHVSFEIEFPTLKSWYSATGTTPEEQENLKNSKLVLALLDIPLLELSSLKNILSKETYKKWIYGLKRFGITE